MTELATNAAKHDVRRVPQVDLRVRTGGRTTHPVSLVVADDGSGIPAREQYVLEQVEETKLDHSDGISLWAVRWIVSSFGGRLEIETADTGTAVRVRFPAARIDPQDG